MAKLRAAVITDIHYGFDVKDKLGSKAPRLMRKFVKAVNKFRPAFVADIGDRISFVDAQTDRHYMQALTTHFNRIAAPVYSAIGNNDVKYLSREENLEITGSPADSYSRDANGYHLVFWNPHFHMTEDGLELDRKDINWLRDNLVSAKGKPALLFSHVPLDNLYGEESAPIDKYFFWSQGEDVRKVMEDAGNVILSMHGHRHVSRYREINGIHYITQQSLTSQWKRHRKIPNGTYTLLEINDDKIKIMLKGRSCKNYELDIKPAP